jgi:hypothetical protein
METDQVVLDGKEACNFYANLSTGRTQRQSVNIFVILVLHQSSKRLCSSYNRENTASCKTYEKM